jgi:hypothetical protein
VDPKRYSGPRADPGQSPQRGPAVGQQRRPDGRVGGVAAGAAGASASAAKGAGAAGGAPPRKGPAVQEALDRVGQDIKQLRVDFERFFSGALPIPPEELRGRVEAQLRVLRNTSVTVAESFRLGDLEARFSSYNEFFNRRLRDREEGRQRSTQSLPREPAGFDAARGILVGDSVAPEAAAALYHGLASATQGPRFDLDTFAAYLLRQAAAIRAKTGCAEVQFRLAHEDGKTKLKARPVGAKRHRS